ncbi:MAG: putative LPS assembly protein LptD [Candidatus Cloacimonetes bacterium]|nr:putative LPS assembly protein LptD [Candidatus Cloacimonadota bacterium]
MSIKIKSLISLLLSLVFTIVTAEEIINSDSLKTEIVYDSLSYLADSSFFFVDQETIILSGNAQLLYQNANITADTIMVNFQKDQAKASGKVIMEDGEQLIISDKIQFDIESQEGLVVGGASSFDMGYVFGTEIRKVGNEVYDIDKGVYTTCDAKYPHFDIRANRMRLYRDHMVVGKPVVFYVNEFPVMGLPYAAFSIRRGRKSGILIPSPGYNPSAGKFIKDIAFYYVFSDYADITFSTDLMEKKGQNYEVDFIYLDRYDYKGEFKGLYENKTFGPDSHGSDWSINYSHFHSLPDKASLDISLDFNSSREVWANETDVNKRLQEQITSKISYRKPFKVSSFYISSTYTEDLVNNNKSIVLPNFSYSLPSKPIHEMFSSIPDSIRIKEHWWKNFSFSWGTGGVHTGYIKQSSPTLSQILYENAKDSLGNFLSEHHLGVRQSASLSWNTTSFGWLKLASSVSYQDAWFDRDKNGKKLVYGYSYSSNSSASMTLYGIRRFSKSPLTAVRHIVTPSVSFRYSPDFSERNDRFYSFGGVGVSAGKRARSIGMSLEQKWQLKLRVKNQKDEKVLNDLFVLRSSTSYNLENEEQPWSDLNHTLTFNPGSYDFLGLQTSFNQSYSANQKPYDNYNFNSWKMNSSISLSGNAKYTDYYPIEKNDFVTGNLFKQDSLSIADQQILTINDLEKLDKPGSWSLTSSHDYSYNRISKYKTENLRNSLNIKLTSNWSLSYSNYYDLEKNELISQSIMVNRDLHCWKLTFSYSKSAKFWQYTLILLNIKLPESLKLETKDNS